MKISRDRLNLSAHASRMSENSQFSAQPKLSITPIIALTKISKNFQKISENFQFSAQPKMSITRIIALTKISKKIQKNFQKMKISNFLLSLR